MNRTVPCKGKDNIKARLSFLIRDIIAECPTDSEIAVEVISCAVELIAVSAVSKGDAMLAGLALIEEMRERFVEFMEVEWDGE